MSRTGAKKNTGSASGAARTSRAGGGKAQMTSKVKSKSKSTLQAKTSQTVKRSGAVRSRDEEVRRKLDNSLGRLAAKQSVPASAQKTPSSSAISIDIATQKMQALSQKD